MALVAVLACASVVACSHQGDSVVLAGDGSRMSSEEIDRDPLALLPAGPIGVLSIDAQAAFQSELGPSAATLIANALPVGSDADFDAKRDIRRGLVGFYSMQGADMAAVIQGNFNPDAIQASVARGAITALGVPLTKLSYAGNDLYVAGSVGFVIVTKHTAVTGNEVGIRRVLDRIRDKRVRREIPDWMVQLIENPKASVVGTVDLTNQPMAAAAAQQVPFLNGLRVGRLLGNFEKPGINFAGAMTYPDPQTAAQSAAQVQRVAQLASYTSLLSLLGLRPPIKDVQVKTEQNDVQFIVSVDGQAAASVLDAMTSSLKKSAQPTK